MKVVIMAGGKGTRISSIASNIPKPMISILGKPVLEHEIICLRNQGYDDFIITISHLGNIIKDYFGDGSKFGVRIEYYFEETPLGNAGALFKIKNKLQDDFLLLNADSMFDIDFNKFVKYHKEKGGQATIFVHPNSHPFDSGLIITNSDNSISAWLSKEDERPKWYKNSVNAGIHILSPSLLEKSEVTEKVDLDRQILKPLCGTGRLFAYYSSEYVKDMGTPERLMNVLSDFEKGIIQKKNLSRKQKAIFLDRDGTINKYVGFLTNINDLELLDGTSDAIKKINQSEYLTIVVTNQPVIARGEVSVEELNMIHNKLETLLGKDGAYLDAIYYCPHHPHKGFLGERAEYKIDCECRKPKPGLLLKAANDFNIDLSQSWMIGDGVIDVEAGIAAGCKTIMLSDSTHDRIKTSTTLLEAVKMILEK